MRYRSEQHDRGKEDQRPEWCVPQVERLEHRRIEIELDDVDEERREADVAKLVKDPRQIFAPPCLEHRRNHQHSYPSKKTEVNRSGREFLINRKDVRRIGMRLEKNWGES